MVVLLRPLSFSTDLTMRVVAGPPNSSGAGSGSIESMPSSPGWRVPFRSAFTCTSQPPGGTSIGGASAWAIRRDSTPPDFSRP